MDAHGLDKLEFARVCARLSQCARTTLGRDLARDLKPTGDPAGVARQLAETGQFLAICELRGLPPFGGISDVGDRLRRAVPPVLLEPEDFANVADTLRGLAQLRTHFTDLPDEFSALRPIVYRLGDHSDIAERIDQVIDPRGRVRDDATPRLARLRQRAGQLTDELRGVFDRVLRQSSIVRLLQYPNATFHADRMVLPLRSDCRGRIPGIIHRSSESGQTLFVEPTEAVEINNGLIRLAREEAEEIGRLRWELTQLLHRNQAGLLETLGAAAEIDLLCAKVELGRRMNLHVPTIDAAGRLRLRGARHPLLMAQAEDAQKSGRTPDPVVPIDVRLGEDFDLLIVTGPNTGGKTVMLKTVGLLTLMAQAGLPIPAEPGATLPVFDDVLVDVGDEQSLQQSLSTFSSHLSRILHILNSATKRTLVLMDELGAGTDPDDGAALGRAIVDQLSRMGCLGIVTTHLGALKALAFEQPRVDNAAVQFDYGSLRPTYELRIGEPGNSNALIIAARLGMPTDLVSAAQRYLSRQDRALARAIEGTIESRRQAEYARDAAEDARCRAEQAEAAASDARARLEAERQRFATWTARLAALRPGDRVRVKRFDKEGRVVHVRLDRQKATVSVGAMEFEVPLTEIELSEDGDPSVDDDG